MSRIQSTFAALAAQQRKGLIPFLVAGDPEPSKTVDYLHALVSAGADVIELGVPFSDPMADGPVIQRAYVRALANGITLRKVLDDVRTFRQSNQVTPIVLMGYANPIERMGVEHFVTAAHEAGVDGVLVVDYPPEESVEFAAQLRARGIDPIFLLAPTSDAQRIAAVARLASGYLYYVSLKGVTGSAALDVVSIAEKIPSIKRETSLPVAVGFGIRDAATARAVGEVADAVVIGSALVQRLEEVESEKAIQSLTFFLAEIRHALDIPQQPAEAP